VQCLRRLPTFDSMPDVSQPRDVSRPGPPHNPGVRELVANKRRFSSPTTRDDAKRGFRGWHEAGRLPHRDGPGLTQFLTFRLAGSFPREVRSEWEHLLDIEDDRERRIELEAYLDRGRGECYLRCPDIASLVETALTHFHEEHYHLLAWVIMSNHVHVLLKVGTVPMSEIVESWKKHTANKANRQLKRRGAFWSPGYFDTFMRDAAHECRTVRYIESNPTKAGLVIDPADWPWSSARFRDRYGGLTL